MGMQAPCDNDVSPIRIEVNGIHMGVLQHGDPTGRPALVFIHGFTGCAANWEPFLTDFAQQGMRVVALDMLGHGNSDAPEDPRRYAMEHCQADIIAALQVLGIAAGEAILIGYSMGGRIALYTALAGYFRALVLESVSPGLSTAEEREQRCRSDVALANCIDEFGLEAFVDYWERRPLFDTQSRLPIKKRAGLRQQRLKNSEIGLANSLRGVGTGAQPPLHERLSEITVPVLLITGEDDKKFCQIAVEMAAKMPQAEHHVIPGAGHTTHFEQPALFEVVVRNFFRSVA
ncbi:2-succinyl-6-hydroxy-2,4-cyclohexadiene-1-carboxylate synthase [Dictyobacter arantiisoli]|uniref:Putative 2-succinyl-6-hydroxy-2,4-cyclohexadiene-1-carboxylate synthase n=1 Tax=Dictyobacter arantiisoli TaxID=2014874 RepID=A0A5A5TC98_9CHLR|nr:2-succinyl-6-hydroxy-2,4-cyclohexadiene-1-carboxylate synthase [Dictyobacter arantiisoli]GCF08564.1 putative 2-succinyl-6-hydroxy-2,4-cyclohexadiene-1-carboxylate synthase [Dictyobacter arantiisoli]